MAEKKSGLGGCLVQILLGFLALVAAVLAVLFFLSSGPVDEEEAPSLADEAAAAAPQQEAPAAAPAPPRPADVSPRVPPPADSGIDPVTDDQIADDAAAAGMTSRTPSPAGE